MNKKYLIAMMIANGIFHVSAEAAYLTETNGFNGDISNAQYISGAFFDTNYDVDINNNHDINISKSFYHASIQGTGDGTVDYYSFNASAGWIYFDIDYGVEGGLNTLISLYDAGGNHIAYSDDYSVDTGSSSSLDSFLGTTVHDGLYVIAVGQCCGINPPQVLSESSSYTLHISQTSLVPVPAAVWLFGSGLIGLVAVARRKVQS